MSQPQLFDVPPPPAQTRSAYHGGPVERASIIDIKTHVRRGDPDTSVRAAERVAANLTKAQVQVLRAMDNLGPVTHPELTAFMADQMPGSGPRSRCKDLVDLALVAEVGKTATHKIWQITERGRAEVRRSAWGG